MPDDLTPQTKTIRLSADGGVLYATLDAPPLNMLGPELVRDMVQLIGYLSRPTPFQVVVFDSADPDFFIPHVDLTKIPEYTAEAAKAGGPGDASLGMLFQRLSRLPVVTIGKLRGRARGGGSEFLLACDIRFASRENAILGQPEVGIGAPPGAGAVERLARLLGVGRALEVLLGADDFTADVAERYGWINRAVPDDELDAFVERFARRVAGFPADAIAATKTAVIPDRRTFRRRNPRRRRGLPAPGTRRLGRFPRRLATPAGIADPRYDGTGTGRSDGRHHPPPALTPAVPRPCRRSQPHRRESPRPPRPAVLPDSHVGQ